MGSEPAAGDRGRGELAARGQSRRVVATRRQHAVGIFGATYDRRASTMTSKLTHPVVLDGDVGVDQLVDLDLVRALIACARGPTCKVDVRIDDAAAVQESASELRSGSVPGVSAECDFDRVGSAQPPRVASGPQRGPQPGSTRHAVSAPRRFIVIAAISDGKPRRRPGHVRSE
ncbi:MAG TPA: hypothetical protein VFT22_22490 [Kofleriaceae bacterium]|nr:hypothetical protein [Kofleriaceae bacterium]